MTNKLPILATAQAVYHQLYDNAGYAFKVVGSLIVLTLALPLTIIMAMGGNWVFMAIAVFGFPIGWLAIAVLWHRRYLCCRAPSLSLVQHFLVSIAYGLDCILVSILANLAFMSAAMIFFVIVGLVNETAADVRNGGLAYYAMAFSALVSVTIFFRFGLALPSTSVRNAGLGIFASWRYTRGNGLRLFAVWILVALPLILLAILSLMLSGTGIHVESRIELVLRMSCASIFFSIALLNTLSLMSIAYEFLVDEKALGDRVGLDTSGLIIRP